MEQGTRLDVAVVGAGPYGLSVAAHLSPTCDVRVFGRPMETWRELMPRDMLLRSDWDHTNLSAPGDRGTIRAWAAAAGERRSDPLPLPMFLRYADWFASTFVPGSDETRVAEIAFGAGAVGGRFTIRTDDGRAFHADHVVLAPGVTPFPYLPPVLRDLPADRVSLAVEASRPDTFKDRRVVVVGAGQNGLEAALRARRAGASSVTVVARSGVRWFASREPHERPGRLRNRLYRLAYPIVGFGPPPMNRLVLHPQLFARMPEAMRERISARILRPGGSPWLRAQLTGTVKFHRDASITSVDVSASELTLAFSDGRRLEADHLVIACGYRFDIARIRVLADDVRSRIERSSRTGWPHLTDGGLTTCPGLYFAGYPTEGTFGPLMRFVEGTRFTARRCAASIARS